MAAAVQLAHGWGCGAEFVHLDFLEGLSGLHSSGFLASIVVEGQSATLVSILVVFGDSIPCASHFMGDCLCGVGWIWRADVRLLPVDCPAIRGILELPRILQRCCPRITRASFALCCRRLVHHQPLSLHGFATAVFMIAWRRLSGNGYSRTNDVSRQRETTYIGLLAYCEMQLEMPKS